MIMETKPQLHKGPHFKFREDLDEILRGHQKQNPKANTAFLFCPAHPDAGFVLAWQPPGLICYCRECRGIVMIVKVGSISEGN
jgi:hypothetical protein